MSEAGDEIRAHDEWGVVNPDFIARVVSALDGGEPKALRALTRDLHAADLADVIEALGQADRVRLISALGRSFDPESLAELDEAVRDELMEALPNDVIASAIKKLDTDDALYLIEDLEDEDQREILSKVPKEDRAALARGLEYPEYTAGRLMKTEFVAVPNVWTVGEATDFIRSEKGLPDEFIEVYVVDPGFHLVGTVPVSRLMRSAREKKIGGDHGRTNRPCSGRPTNRPTWPGSSRNTISCRRRSSTRAAACSAR